MSCAPTSDGIAVIGCCETVNVSDAASLSYHLRLYVGGQLSNAQMRARLLEMAGCATGHPFYEMEATYRVAGRRSNGSGPTTCLEWESAGRDEDFGGGFCVAGSSVSFGAGIEYSMRFSHGWPVLMAKRGAWEFPAPEEVCIVRSVSRGYYMPSRGLGLRWETDYDTPTHVTQMSVILEPDVTGLPVQEDPENDVGIYPDPDHEYLVNGSVSVNAYRRQYRTFSGQIFSCGFAGSWPVSICGSLAP